MQTSICLVSLQCLVSSRQLLQDLACRGANKIKMSWSLGPLVSPTRPEQARAASAWHCMQRCHVRAAHWQA